MARTRLASAFVAALMLASCASSTTVTKSSTTTSPAANTTVAATTTTIAAPATTAPLTTTPLASTTTSPATTIKAAPVAEVKPCNRTTVGGDRPAKLHVPASYECGKAAPLLILLHGYSANGTFQEAYFKLTAESDKRGFLYVVPEGTKDGVGNQFWNATDSCCNFAKTPIDDSAYISGLITEMAEQYNVDSKRVYLMGHSNGGFMSYRMACEHGDQIAAIVSLAGAMWSDVSKCPAATPVSVLQIHGTDDAVIKFAGGALIGNAYPAASQTVADWVATNGCSAASTAGAPLDLANDLDSTETTTVSYPGCKNGTSVAFWTIARGPHTPALSDAFTAAAVDFLYAQHKP
jgi:polyhydroxybutyrate depolymerase